MSQLRIITALCLVLCASGLHAQSAPDVVVARATTGKLQTSLIDLVADTFKPTELTGTSLERAKTQSADQVISGLCGQVSNAYYAKFLELNGGAVIAHETPLGDEASKLRFPACLKVRPISGRWWAPLASPTTDPFKAQAIVDSLSQKSVKTGGTAVNGSLAIPTELVPKDNISLPDAVKAVAGPSGVGQAVVTSGAPMRGHIVEVVDRSSIDPNSAQAKACPAQSRPFNPALVRSAYEYSLGRRPITAQRGYAHLVVVDNGFFGVKPGFPPSFPASFPKRLFGLWGEQASLVGPTTSMDDPDGLGPVNYLSGLPAGSVPTAVEGHGTHVAGIAIGGPDFASARDSLFGLASLTDEARLDLTIFNIGKGGSELIVNSQSKLSDLMRSGPDGAMVPDQRIVNMSIAYEQRQAEGTFTSLFTLYSHSLFIVAAGNRNPQGDDVGVLQTYPGALGNRPNVISVAAHDATDESQLAWFSNFGPTTVDIAAPGCGIDSWLDGSNRDFLTGTSQATPLVAFAAVSLTTLDNSLDPYSVKKRVLISGGLLSGGDYRWAVVSGSKLDMVVALLLYDDVIEVRVKDDSQPTGFRKEIWIGDLTDQMGLRCATEYGSGKYGRKREDLWAWKRDGEDSALFFDRGSGRVTPCPSTMEQTLSKVTPFVKFRRRAMIVGDKVESDATLGPEQTFTLSDLDRIVLRGPFAGSEK